MIECQYINKVLDSHDYSLVSFNSIDETFFKDYKDEFRFIVKHYDTYGTVPDKATFITAFPKFVFTEVLESDRYLLDTLHENKFYNNYVPILLKAAELAKNDDSRASAEYLQSELPKLSTQFSCSAVELVSTAKTRYDWFAARRDDIGKFYIPTGLDELDALIGGWDSKDEYAILTGRPGMGKSWWLEMFMLNAAKRGKICGMFSGEMLTENVATRIDTLYSNISNYKLTRGHGEVGEKYKASLDKFSNMPGKMYIATPDMLGGKPTVSKLRTFIDKYHLEILFIDQYSLLDDESGARGRNEKFEAISREIKLLQTQVKIPIIMAAQLNRAATGKDAPDDPGTDNIAGSDRLAQDASLAISIRQKDGNVILQIMKNRTAVVGDKLIYKWRADTGELSFVANGDNAKSADYSSNDEFSLTGDEPF